MEELNLTWFEEPVICHDHEGEAADRGGARHADRRGETVHTHRGILRMLQAKAADVLMPDLQRMGGPTEFLKAGELCEAFNMPVSSHLFPEMSLPLLGGIARGLFLEHMPWFEPLYGSGSNWTRGATRSCPNGPAGGSVSIQSNQAVC